MTLSKVPADIPPVVAEWLRLDPSNDTKQQVLNLWQSDKAAVEKMMAPRIAFGTSGLRAKMAPGFANMNVVTVQQASQGLAVYMEQTVKDAKTRGIVVGHDHRHNSREFALVTAKTFSKRGFVVHYLGLVHTPLVPFGVGRFKAAGGVCVTASHNPAQDNGYKVYWENACQIIPPHDDGIAKQIFRNLELWSLESEEFDTVDLLPAYTTEILCPLTVSNGHLNALGKVVYTPVHGVGAKPARASFQLLNVDACVVPEQEHPDPDFPTVKFPNPEEKGALDRAMRYADSLSATVVLANDPDADRFSLAVNERGWKQLTGDQIGILFADAIFRHHQCELKKNCDTANNCEPQSKLAVINTAVSSQQLQKLAEIYHVYYCETLTGFKWLGNKAIELVERGYTVPLAYEEAIGYMVSPKIFDKDGISALHRFLPLLAEIYAAGKTVFGELDRIARATGYFATHNAYYTVDSPVVTTKTFAAIREQPFPAQRTHIGELEITSWRDLTVGYDSSTADHQPLLPVSAASEMLTVYLKFPGESTTARFTARGSGTEPKLKVYIEAMAKSAEEAQSAADHVWDLLAREWFSHIR